MVLVLIIIIVFGLILSLQNYKLKWPQGGSSVFSFSSFANFNVELLSMCVVGTICASRSAWLP